MAHWQPLYHYTILFCSTGNPYNTLLYSTGPLKIPLSLYFTLWAHCQFLYLHTILYYAMLAHWQSQYQFTILYWPTGSPYICILYSTGSHSSAILFQPTDSPKCQVDSRDELTRFHPLSIPTVALIVT